MNNTPPPSSTAARRLIILLGVLLGVVIYSAGWRITGINLEETRDETRQNSIQRTLTGLLSPDIFDQDSTGEVVNANFVKGCVDGEDVDIEQPTHEEGQPYVEFSSYCGSQNDTVTIEGFDFHPNSLTRIYVIRPTGNRQPFRVVGKEQESDPSIFDIGNDGNFSIDVIIPNLRGDDGDLNPIEIEAQWATSTPYTSTTTNDVIEKIIETVFLALMATTIAIPVAVILSFTAARNLMRQIRLPLGETLIGFILLPIGFARGGALLGPVGKIGVEFMENASSDLVGLLLSIGLPIVAFVAFNIMSRYANSIKLEGTSARARGIIVNILLLLTVVFSLGAIASIFVWVGGKLDQSAFYNIQLGEIIEFKSPDMGMVVGTLGEIGQLTISLVAGLAGALFLSSIGTSITSGLLKGVRGTTSYVLGAILGVIGGGILLAITAGLGSLVPLFTIIPPVAATALGAPMIGMLYDRVSNRDNQKPKREEDETTIESTTRTIIMIVGALIIFILTAHILEVLSIFARERVPQANVWQTLAILGQEVTISEFIANATLIGAILGGIGGALAGTHAMFPLGMAVYNTSRTILNIIRSTEPLIMAIVFVIWVGAGPFAGMLALALHSVAALGKLYSEQVENIDQGPIEALQATGANRLQTIIYSVIPQIVPPYIAFTMYRWDINVRMSTIIGFVGGGGIGFLLQQQINLLRYEQAGVAVLAIAIVVSILDYASAAIRERIV